MFSPQELFAQPQDPYIGIVRTTIVLRKPMILILFLVVPVAFGAIATLASRPYRVGVTSVTSGPPACTLETDTTWYGLPIPWFYTSDEKLVAGGCYVFLLHRSEVVVVAFLLDVLIYVAICYAPILAYSRITRLDSSPTKPVP